MSDFESTGTYLNGRRFPRKSDSGEEAGNGGTGPYAIPNYKPKNSKQQLALDTAIAFNKIDDLKYFVKYVHHFGIPVFERLLAKLKEAKDVQDKGKYLNAIIQEALDEEKDKLAKKDKDCDNSSR